ncbi:MAG: helix-turn-helix transcriptional regulator [Clostridiales bacterium]|jgi:transcriptional regulator with XRE-family HTH domain|nr:helix-turn-helix transcriptional regulator [Clostridiales bacterium]
MYEEEYFGKRISQLRTAKGVSARDMSLSLGQSESYINKIENGKSMPSMQVFFYICEYFNITPKEFFDDGNRNPALMQAVIDDLKTLDERQITNIHEIIKGLKK